METKKRVQIIMEAEDMINSLHIAIESSGGSKKGCTTFYLEEISAIELIAELCTNSIRFYHRKPDSEYSSIEEAEEKIKELSNKIVSTYEQINKMTKIIEAAKKYRITMLTGSTDKERNYARKELFNLIMKSIDEQWDLNKKSLTEVNINPSTSSFTTNF